MRRLCIKHLHSRLRLGRKILRVKGGWLEGNGVIHISSAHMDSQSLWQHTQDLHRVKSDNFPVRGRGNGHKKSFAMDTWAARRSSHMQCMCSLVFVWVPHNWRGSCPWLCYLPVDPVSLTGLWVDVSVWVGMVGELCLLRDGEESWEGQGTVGGGWKEGGCDWVVKWIH